MSRSRSRLLGGRRLRAVVVAAGICPALAGCSALPSGIGESSAVPRLLSLGTRSEVETEAFKREVQNDPFPTAPKAKGQTSAQR